MAKKTVTIAGKTFIKRTSMPFIHEGNILYRVSYIHDVQGEPFICISSKLHSSVEECEKELNFFLSNTTFKKLI